MENKDIILFILVIFVVYLLYRDICNRREKFAETTSSTSSSSSSTGAKPTTIIPTKNGESMNITEAIKNLGIIAKQLQKDNNFVFPGNLTVKGKLIVEDELTVNNRIEIPDVIDFGKMADERRRLIQFGNPENKGDHLDINMNNNHIRDADVIYCKKLGGPAEGIKLGNHLDLGGNDIKSVNILTVNYVDIKYLLSAGDQWIAPNGKAKLKNLHVINVSLGELRYGVPIKVSYTPNNWIAYRAYD